MNSFTSPRPWLAAAVILASASLTACDSPDERMQMHMDRGTAFFEAGSYEKARVEFKQALQLNPTNGHGYYYLGRIYEEQRQWSDAMRAYGQAVAQAPDHLDANIRLGRYFIMVDDLASALARAEHVISLTGGEHVDGYALRSAVYLGQRNFEQAYNDARHVLKIDPANTTAASVLVVIHRNNDNVAEAARVLTRAIARNPDEVALRLMKIALHLDVEQNEEAESEALALLEIEPQNLAFRIDLARLYVSWGRLDDAEALLREMVQLEPGNVTAKLVLVDFLANRRSPRVAERALRSFIFEAPEAYELRFSLAELLRRRGNDREAVAVLEEVIARRPGTQEARDAQIGLAGLLFARGKVDEAKGWVTAALDDEPRNTRALMLRARIQLREQHVAEAIGTLRTVIRDTPDSQAALKLLAQAYLDHDQQELAVDTLHRLIATAPDDIEAKVSLGQVLMKGGQFESALKLLNDVLERSPSDLRALAVKAETLVLLGRFPEANATVQRIRGIPGGETIAPRLEARIAAAGAGDPNAEAALGLAHAAAPEELPFEAGNGEQAIASLRRAADADPRNVEVRISLAQALERTGRFTEAMDVYQALMDGGHRDVVVINNLAALIADHAYQDEERVAKAIRLMEPFESSTNALVIDTIGWLHFRAGNVAEARSLLERAVALDGDHAVLRRHLSEVYEHAGQHELAQRNLNGADAPHEEAAGRLEGVSR